MLWPSLLLPSLTFPWPQTHLPEFLVARFDTLWNIDTQVCRSTSMSQTGRGHDSGHDNRSSISYIGRHLSHLSATHSLWPGSNSNQRWQSLTRLTLVIWIRLHAMLHARASEASSRVLSWHEHFAWGTFSGDSLSYFLNYDRIYII